MDATFREREKFQVDRKLNNEQQQIPFQKA